MYTMLRDNNAIAAKMSLVRLVVHCNFSFEEPMTYLVIKGFIVTFYIGLQGVPRFFVCRFVLALF
jgi:uncharacterized membrane protein